MYNSHVNSSSNLTFITGGVASGVVTNGTTLKNSSLKSNNIKLLRAYYYKDGNYIKVDYWVEMYNTRGASPYKNLYFIPVHFKIQYRNENTCVTDLASNASKYSGYQVKNTYTSKVTLYRSYSYQRDYSDVKWSTSKSLSGYEATGKTQWR